MYELIVGRGGCSRADFFRMTFAEMGHYVKGLSERDRLDWERTRQIMWSAIQPHLKNQKSPADLFPFAWEKPAEEELTDEERAAIIAQGREFERQMKEQEKSCQLQ